MSAPDPRLTFRSERARDDQEQASGKRQRGRVDESSDEGEHVDVFGQPRHQLPRTAARTVPLRASEVAGRTS